MTGKILIPESSSKPKVVSYPHLRDTLLPYTAGYKWGEDAIRDLWLMGSPVPQASICPEDCEIDECEHIKRILLPTQFQKWWNEVQLRMSHNPEIGAVIHGRI